MNKNEILKLVNKSNPIIFEIGCADGQDTQDFINIFKDLNIYCFEPEPKNIKIIKDRINYNKFKLFEGVVSNSDDPINFLRSRTDNPNDLSYSGSIKKPVECLRQWPQIKFDQQIIVQSTKIDTFCKKNNINFIDFIWADTQGAELEVILGGKEMFTNKIKYFYTEYANIEYYENQPNLQKITQSLGNNWKLIKDFKTDALFENISI